MNSHNWQSFGKILHHPLTPSPGASVSRDVALTLVSTLRSGNLEYLIKHDNYWPKHFLTHFILVLFSRAWCSHKPPVCQRNWQNSSGDLDPSSGPDSRVPTDGGPDSRRPAQAVQCGAFSVQVSPEKSTAWVWVHCDPGGCEGQPTEPQNHRSLYHL